MCLNYNVLLSFQTQNRTGHHLRLSLILVKLDWTITVCVWNTLIMNQQVPRRTNAPAQVWLYWSLSSDPSEAEFELTTCCQIMQSKQKLLEALLSKSHECNTLAQKNSTFRLQLQRTLVSVAQSVGCLSLGSRLTTSAWSGISRVCMKNRGTSGRKSKYDRRSITSLRRELIDLRAKIRRARAFLDSM